MTTDRAIHEITNEPLLLDMLEWIARQPRTYAEVMDAWRTSCPRLPVWEDAVALGFVERTFRPGDGAIVTATDAGLVYLQTNGRAHPHIAGDPRP